MTAIEPSRADTARHPRLSDQGIALSVQEFSLWYGRSQALDGISLDVQRGLVTALIGPSGCGKSTLLRAFNRMNDLLEGLRVMGRIEFDGRDIHAPGTDVIALRKRMGMVFQRANPFPKSIRDNVAFPLRVDGIRNRSVISEAVERALRAAALWDEVKDRLEENALTLSGGQQQRLCIARAIAGAPELLLMDEPCAALDPIATAKVEELINQLAGDYTLVIVTHNMQQAARIAHNTAFLHQGRLVEYGDTETLFTVPRRPETQDYLTGRFG